MEAALLKQQHDELLQQVPAGAIHDVAECPLCNDSFGDDQALERGEKSMYSEDELKVAVDGAVAPLQARITELLASTEQAELETKIAEAKTPLEEQVADLQGQLDAAVLETQTAKDELTNTLSYLESAKADEEAEVEFTRLREERITQVREAASFTEDYVEANADRWAHMDAESFDAALDEWKMISTKPSIAAQVIDPKVPAETAMRGATVGEKAKPEGMALMRQVLDGTLRGNDPRKV